MLMNWKTQYCPDVNSSQFGLQSQCKIPASFLREMNKYKF